jgi:hypothetical protein
MHHKPFLAAVHPSTLPVNILMIHASEVSTANRNSAMTTTNANTIPVVWIVSLRVGHATRPASAHASCANAKNSFPGADSHATPAASEKAAEHHQHAQNRRRLGEVVVTRDAGCHARHRESDL